LKKQLDYNEANQWHADQAAEEENKVFAALARELKKAAVPCIALEMGQDTVKPLMHDEVDPDDSGLERLVPFGQSAPEGVAPLPSPGGLSFDWLYPEGTPDSTLDFSVSKYAARFDPSNHKAFDTLKDYIQDLKDETLADAKSALKVAATSGVASPTSTSTIASPPAPPSAPVPPAAPTALKSPAPLAAPTAPKPPAPPKPATSAAPMPPVATPPPATAQNPVTVYNSGTPKTSAFSDPTHLAWFQSNPYMLWAFPSPYNPEGQYFDMDYNPSKSYFSESPQSESKFTSEAGRTSNPVFSTDGTPNSAIETELPAAPADPRWDQCSSDSSASWLLPKESEKGNREKHLQQVIDRWILASNDTDEVEKEDWNIKDYNDARPLNPYLDLEPNQAGLLTSIDAVPQEDLSLHHTQPRLRGIGPQGLMTTYGCEAPNSDPYMDDVIPYSPDGSRFFLPSPKPFRPVTNLPMDAFIKTH
jgi:hypothetical protein